MRWANAGHLPPLVVNPDGSVAELATWKGDLLLGVDPDALRRESVVTLDRGSTVPLYTDGLIERRDEVLERLVDGHPEDDVALVAVRPHRQDRPRPAEAGPVEVPPNVSQDPATD
jgi:hypothetical protein